MTGGLRGIGLEEPVLVLTHGDGSGLAEGE